uniref:Uncharacterized protein n=1 Tax=Trypanosoma vivax (strain Y486) TaxID=1055687 RepID=G0TWL6_TRYVY|nr:hypothetical protein TVY486_0601450 [Trypanosoma vivax Y486]
MHVFPFLDILPAYMVRVTHFIFTLLTHMDPRYNILSKHRSRITCAKIFLGISRPLYPLLFSSFPFLTHPFPRPSLSLYYRSSFCSVPIAGVPFFIFAQCARACTFPVPKYQLVPVLWDGCVCGVGVRCH